MTIKIEDQKLKARLAQYVLSELIGDSVSRAKLSEDDLARRFDKIWEEKLQNAIGKAIPCDFSYAYLMLTKNEKRFLDPAQKLLQFRLENEGWKFIAQVTKTSADDEGTLTQLWRIISPEIQLDVQKQQMYFELISKQEEAQVWSEVYFKLGENRKNWYLLIGAPAAVLAILAGSSFLLDKIVGIITLVAGMLTALQTFLDLGRQSEKLEASGKGWGKLARKIGQQIWDIQYTNVDPQEHLATLKEVIEEMNAMEDFSPIIPSPIYENAKKKIAKQIEERKSGAHPTPAQQTAANPKTEPAPNPQSANTK